MTSPPRSNVGASNLRKFSGLCLLALNACVGQPAALSASRQPDDSEPAVIERQTETSTTFTLDGKAFCFSGANNYYLSYKPENVVLDVLETAHKMGLSVIRTWAFLDRGSLDGTMRNIHEPGHHDGIYFHYWDSAERKPAFNDGPSGLEKLDFVLHHARRLNLKVILPLTNNWQDFGGIDQYVLWFGLKHHHLFYEDARARKAYRDWVQHLILRVNTIDGVLYRDDPAIFAWELANEPRTKNGKEFDSDDGWTTSTLTDWADEMSTFIKSLDPNHLVSVGDEGFLNQAGADFTRQAEGGVDHEALTSLKNIDFGTFHLYPDHWQKSQQWGIEWIESHLSIARTLKKPSILEEYGIQVKRRDPSSPIRDGESRRLVAYTNYNRAITDRGGAGSLFWLLAGIDVDGQRYPDYDGFSIYEGEKDYSLLRELTAKHRSDAQACEHQQIPRPSSTSNHATPYVGVSR